MYIVYLISIAQAIVPVCPTAVWNQTWTVLAGSSGNRGTTAILLYNPYSSFIDVYGNLYVVDYYNHRIQYFLRGSFSSLSHHTKFLFMIIS